MQQAQNSQQDDSILQDLLDKVPSGVFGDKNESGKASDLKANATAHQMQNTQISPRQPEQWLRYLTDAQAQIYPILEFHDDIMKSVTETIENIPILPDLIEQIQDQINVFVFSLLAPFVLPIINQVKTELNTGSNEIIQSSAQAQHIVFNDDRSSDPTHSMLSKDHFSNVLNEPAGKVAGQILKWAVPQLIACWDDESIDVDRTLDRIISGVLHHPALRDFGQDGASDGRHLMFGVVEQWWQDMNQREQEGLREQLSREGVESGRNHKPGVVDHGHGSAKPLGMPKSFASQSPGASSVQDDLGKLAGQAVGGGALGAIVGGLAGGIGANMLGDDFDGKKETFKRQSYGQDGSLNETITQVGQTGNRHEQAQYTRTEGRDGRRHEEFTRFEQKHEGGKWESEVHREERTPGGQFHEETRRFDSDHSQQRLGEESRHHGYGGSGSRTEEPSYGRRQDPEQEYGRRHDEPEQHQQNRRQEEEPQFGRHRQAEDETPSYGRHREGYEARSEGLSGGRRDENESGFGGRHQEPEFGAGRFNRSEPEPEFGGGRHGRHQREEELPVPGGFGGGRDEPEFGGGYGGRQQEGFGGGRFNRPAPEPDFGGGRHGRHQQEDEFSVPGGFGGGRNEPDFGGGHGGRQQEPQYGGGNRFGGGREEAPGYGRDEEESRGVGFGGGRHGQPGYGPQRFDGGDGDERGHGGGGGMPGGFGERDEDQGQGHGGRRRRGGNEYGGY